MVATVLIIETNGAATAPTTTDKTSGTVRFCNADSATPGTNNPLVVPAAGTEYSYEKYLRMKVTVAPDTNLTNLKMYTDGANGFGAGVGMFAKTAATYVAPAEATATAGYTNAFSYTSGSALSLGAGPHTGTGEKGAYAMLIMTVGTGASQGSLTPETLTFSYDEI